MTIIESGITAYINGDQWNYSCCRRLFHFLTPPLKLNCWQIFTTLSCLQTFVLLH